jgi:biotin-dependent carboxylase-like uncharacterized protein
MIEVLRAPAFATVQDAGRPGFRRSGVPPGGAMDRAALQAGSTVVGNSPDAAAIEWALTGGALRFTAVVTVALTGARTVARLDGASVPHAAPVTAAAGSILEIDRLVRGRFCYVCVRGGLDVPTVLGGRGTYLPAQFGGLDGRLLRSGDRLGVGTATARSGPAESTQVDTLDESARITVLAGPQAGVLSAREWESLLGTELLVSAHSDRSGYRLTGFRPESSYTADAASEPSCVGAVQLTPDGTLIVLMPDGPTVAGYPKVAVVTSRSIARVAQRATGAAVRLELVELQETLTHAAPPG